MLRIWQPTLSKQSQAFWFDHHRDGRTDLLCRVRLACRHQEIRTWTDSTGKFQIKAKFVEMTDGKATLEREDGTRITIALDKLSEADKKVVAEIQANEENPFKAAKPAKKADEGSEGDQAEAGEAEMKVLKPRWSGVKQVLMASSKSGGKWEISIESPSPPAASDERAIALPAKRDFFDSTRGLVINPRCHRAAIGQTLEKPGGDADRPTRVLLCDLGRARS